MDRQQWKRSYERICAKKLNAVITAKKHSITAVTKVCCISRIALAIWIKHLKFRREGKLFTPFNVVGKLG
ncbi:hypothetical protein [Wolbachia endosymbiont of Litomosoides brasiliensis]|uniref:hypothetical protein n=1 Tax=Wolbachia endosymbiont of Litomosoides brasiliensis TaxID=1812117 RepID=UPI00158A274D|nr:hypothetical protein [Wolbachia endosymbiont of Litomosoides brasiliensis]